MLNEFNKYITENSLIKPGERILLAVSGGIDSMVMAHLFLMSGFETGVAHCNFSLRASESDQDEELVRQFASGNKIPFYSKHFETKEYATENGLSLQMAARELRYKWFEEIRTNNRYHKIGVAHNLSDNVETLIINLTRGTGLTGLAGMKPIKGKIIRPLLFATREEIVKYRNIHRIKYREDVSNADTKYIRNKIRHRIIPVLKEINPSIETTLNETAGRLAGINEIVSDYICDLNEKVSEKKNTYITFNISLLRKHLHNKALLFELFKPFGLVNVQLNDLLKVIEGKNGGQIFTATNRIMKNRKEIIVIDKDSKEEIFYSIDDIDGLSKIPGIESAMYTDITSSFQIPSDPLIACIDSTKITFPLVIRRWKAGDYFYPLGINHRKKLSDYFINSKYSIIEKANKLILESDGKIVWIIGDRIDNRFRITGSTRKTLVIKVQDEGSIPKSVNKFD